MARPLPPAMVPVLLMTMSYAPIELIAWVVAASMVPLLLMVALPLAIEIATSSPEIVPALVKVPPPFASMPLDCLLTMLAPAALTSVALPDMNAPRPPEPLAVIAPVLVIMPGDRSFEAIPCEPVPETLMVPLLVMTLLPAPP